ncbi:uncharacterized protein LOC111391231 [Olea europaea var. sylvestris]|uniref:uncharacterized protein LOC111391231 n=1 Tax=Olea europaea var. sylvestris TaxID=158386 RepID=UPI000C1D6D42|nr:uncharacterized protein LOC111391231 [Olea europaea var. sylvestris]
MAYSHLLSLTHILQRTLKYDCSYLLPGEKQQIASLLEKAVYLQDFLDNFPKENIESFEGLERKISDAACQTEDIIEFCIADRVLEESASHSGDIFTTSFHEIAKLIEEVDSIKIGAGKIEDESGIQEDLEHNTSLPAGSLRPASSGQSTMVGLDDAMVEIMGHLVGSSSKLEVVKLKYLQLYRVDLKSWRADSIHFPRLERLVIWDCYELDEIPSGFEEIPTLQYIELDYCGDSIVESAKKIEEAQLDWGNDAFELYIKTIVKRR